MGISSKAPWSSAQYEFLFLKYRSRPISLHRVKELVAKLDPSLDPGTQMGKERNKPVPPPTSAHASQHTKSIKFKKLIS